MQEKEKRRKRVNTNDVVAISDAIEPLAAATAAVESKKRAVKLDLVGKPGSRVHRDRERPVNNRLPVPASDDKVAGSCGLVSSLFTVFHVTYAKSAQLRSHQWLLTPDCPDDARQTKAKKASVTRASADSGMRRSKSTFAANARATQPGAATLATLPKRRASARVEDDNESDSDAPQMVEAVMHRPSSPSRRRSRHHSRTNDNEPHADSPTVEAARMRRRPSMEPEPAVGGRRSDADEMSGEGSELDTSTSSGDSSSTTSNETPLHAPRLPPEPHEVRMLRPPPLPSPKFAYAPSIAPSYIPLPAGV
jgi:hypothetical protein